MKALILASGKGSRLRSLSSLPKVLLKIGSKTIIERILDSFIDNNIRNVIITTGFKEDKIREFILSKVRYKILNIDYIYNSKYDKTNYIYSLWLTKDKLINEDVILVHGDVVFDPLLLRKLNKKRTSHVAVSRKKYIEPKDLKVKIKNNKVIFIGLTPPDNKNIFLCTSMFKLINKDMKIWMNEIGIFVNKGIVGCYAEDAFNVVSKKMNLRPLYYDKELGMDVDNQKDLRRVRKLLKSG